ncbi:MAG: GC-type dockerin domain-anchored protein [Phycisphaerales bacterium]|nr:GC-type dockerin domain-anchored protein [Phycisphaerales bacterium]
MKKSQALALLALAGSSAAFAAPRESVTFNGVPSYARQGDAGNTTMTATFNGADGGGTYAASYLTIGGTLTRAVAGTYFTEASILVTPPSGTPFIVQPYNTTTAEVAGGPVVLTGNVQAGRYTIPVSAITTAGTWSFQFFERWDDVAAGNDATWDSVTITLEDGTPPAATPIGPVGQTYNDVVISGLTAAPGFDQSFTVPAGTMVAGVRLRAQGTGLTTPGATNTTTSPTNAVRIRVTPPGAAALAAGVVFPTYNESTGLGELIISLPTPIDSGSGSWRVEGYESLANFTTHLHSLAIELLPLQAPVATDLGALVANTPAVGNATVTGTGQTKWFKFTLNDEIAAAFNRGLEIDTEGSTTTDGGGLLNTSIGLYNSTTGARIATDFVDGTQSLGTLTFGVDNRPAPGDGLPYNGRDGATLAVGTYFVAVTAGDTGIAYQPGLFGVTNTSTQLGAVRLNVQLVSPGAVAPVAADAGTIAGGAGGTELITPFTASITAANQIKWIQFTTTADAVGGGNFFDIFTDLDSTISDTELGVYRTDGTRVASDDDDGVGLKSFLSFGAGGGSTVGDGVVVSNGRDGDLTAGTYYVATGAYNVAYGATFWNVTTTGTALGDIVVKFATNIPPGAACGLADVGGVGGAPGADAHLDNNDFVVFIDYFFSQNPIADQGSTGGVAGADGVYDNNDFIVFIDNFFNAPASCR